jgi:hypothetical protein
MDELSAEAHERLAARQGFPPAWTDMAELERAADAWFADWLAIRGELARERGGRDRLSDRLDRAIRTEEPEHLDDPDFPVQGKLRIVRGLHAFNVIYRSYGRYIRLLAPLIEEIARREGRPARLLELASGSGELALELGRRVRDRGLPVVITGSDYVPEYLERATTRARERDLPVEFELLNAFDMSDVEPGRFDAAFVIGSTHHFTHGQVAKMIAQARTRATTAFVNLDPRRSVPHLLGILLYPSLTLQLPLLHDAWISARKFFSVYELETVARIAAPGAEITWTPATPCDAMTVRFDRS